MKATMNFKSSDFSELKMLQKKSPSAFQKGKEKGAIQLLTWMNNGSPGESRKPPIRYGVLRGSSSVFVGGRLIELGPTRIKAGASDKADPVRSYSAPDSYITVIYNTTYAAKMHEWKGGWGEFTKQDGDAGNKWIEMHLKSDKDLLMKVIGMEVKKDLGL